MDREYVRMKIVLMIFKVLGLAPWNIVRGSRGINDSNRDIPETMTQPRLACSKLDCVYPTVFVIFTFGMWIAVFSYTIDGDNAGKTQITVAIEVVISVSGNVIAMALRLMLCVKQKTVVKLFNRLIKIDGSFVCLTNDRYFKSDELFFILLFSTNASSIAIYTVAEQISFGDFFVWIFIYILPIATIMWFVMQYVVMVKLVGCRFRALNRGLRDSSSYFDVEPITVPIVDEISINRYCSQKIVTFRRAHTALYEINRDVSAFYSLPILPVIAFASGSTIYIIHFFGFPVLLGESVTLSVLITFLSSIVMLMLPIVMLSAVINRTNFEMKQTVYAVHELLGRACISRENKTELRRFSLELLQRNVEFTAYGFFSLDCTLLHSIFSGIVTYLIIIFQFQST